MVHRIACRISLGIRTWFQKKSGGRDCRRVFEIWFCFDVGVESKQSFRLGWRQTTTVSDSVSSATRVPL